ncbi:MAG: DUF58 domain-containing protein [Alphaproteobacteria bacterium]|nr:DUF58 domain-containing protein [Alphaproteobacteria bacterium]
MAGELPAAVAARVRQRAEQLAGRFPPLLVAAERIAAVVAQGVHGRRRVGSGETFWQFRRYQPGDPINRIDWRQTAKSQRAFVRETEWEASQSVWLWPDQSASMHYASRPGAEEKAVRGNLLALALAVLLIRGGELVAHLGHDRTPVAGRTAVNRITDRFARGLAATASLPPVLPLPRYAQVVLISDFLSPIEEIDALVRSYVARGVGGHLLQILDPAETDLPFAGRTLFAGLEGEGSTIVRRVENVRSLYVERLQRHLGALHDLARSNGWTYARHRTDHPPQAALLALHLALGSRRDR